MAGKMNREEGKGRGKRISVKLIAYETNMARTERSEGNGSMPVFDDCLLDGDAEATSQNLHPIGHQERSTPMTIIRCRDPARGVSEWLLMSYLRK